MKTSNLKKLAAAQMHRRSFLKGILATGTVSIFTPRLLFAADGTPIAKAATDPCA